MAKGATSKAKRAREREKQRQAKAEERQEALRNAQTYQGTAMPMRGHPGLRDLTDDEFDARWKRNQLPPEYRGGRT